MKIKKVLCKWKVGRREGVTGSEAWAQKAFWLKPDDYNAISAKVERVITEPGKPEPQPPGRPGKYRSNAERQKAYRSRKRARREEESAKELAGARRELAARLRVS
jgi:hypothetical protein